MEHRPLGHRAPARAEQVASNQTVYGLDIETDTTVDGLDPEVAAVVAVAVASDTGDTVLTHPDEAELLREVSGLLTALPAGVLVTWNGAAFDLPFLEARARRHGVEIGLALRPDPRSERRAGTRSGDDAHDRGTVQASWHHHRHLDAFRLYRHDVGRIPGLSCGLKAMAALVGIDAVSVDASRIHELDADELRAYVASDARCARQLALRRWPTASQAVDPWIAPASRAPMTGALR